MPLSDAAQEHGRLVEWGGMGIRPLECLESGSHHLLDEPFLADWPWSPAELGDG